MNRLKVPLLALVRDGGDTGNVGGRIIHASLGHIVFELLPLGTAALRLVESLGTVIVWVEEAVAAGAVSLQVQCVVLLGVF